MSGELSKGRRRLAGIGASLKMGKYLAAAQALNDALSIVLSAFLLKPERKEFEEMLDKAVYALNNSRELRQVYPLVLTYKPGEEKKLLDQVFEMRKVLQEDVNADAQKDLQALEARKTEGLARGQGHLDNKEFDAARQTFDKLVGEFPGDATLKADIAERYQKAGLNKDAVGHLSAAIEDSPDSLYLYNRIGILLRKMKDYRSAENYYQRALGITEKDEYLFFNLGRLYLDWRRWDKTTWAAQKALDINPEFREAKQLLAYAKKQMGR